MRFYLSLAGVRLITRLVWRLLHAVRLMHDFFVRILVC